MRGLPSYHKLFNNICQLLPGVGMMKNHTDKPPSLLQDVPHVNTTGTFTIESAEQIQATDGLGNPLWGTQKEITRKTYTKEDWDKLNESARGRTEPCAQYDLRERIESSEQTGSATLGWPFTVDTKERDRLAWCMFAANAPIHKIPSFENVPEYYLNEAVKLSSEFADQLLTEMKKRFG